MNSREENRAGAFTPAVRRIAAQTYPADGAQIEGGFVLFAWDWRDFPGLASRSRLVIKPRRVGQSAEEAFEVNESRIELDLEFTRFVNLETSRLGEDASGYVWRVFGYDQGGSAEALAVSGVREFSLIGGRLDLGGVSAFLPEGGLEPGEAEPVRATRSRRTKIASACPNGDLEYGTLEGWKGYFGSRANSATIHLNNMAQGIVPGRHTIVTAGSDPILAPLNISLPQVDEGLYAVRLGNAGSNASADLLAYTFTVTAQNQYFSFRYALVLEDPGHPEDQQPFFNYMIIPGNSIYFGPGHMPVVARKIVADRANPFFKSKGDLVYREWTPVCIDLSSHLGSQMTIVFGVTDCAVGGHFGYAYIDGLCIPNAAVADFSMPLEICASADLIADGSASTGETSHFWSIEESDANWGRNPQTEVSQWFVGDKAGAINLTAFYKGKGRAFKCNSYYRIGLAVQSDCTPWNATTKLLFARCPKVNAGPDACVSCIPNGGTTQLGAGSSAPAPGVTYAWSPAAGLSNASVPRPIHSHGSVSYPITYTLTVTDSQGCAASDSVTLYCKPPTVELVVQEGCCSVRLAAFPAGHARIEWSTGATAVESIDVTQPGTYSVTVSNPCGTATKSVAVPASQGLTGPFNPVAAESQVGSSPLPNAMHIKDVVIGSPAGIAGVPHAYNATAYRLEIFDRWGHLIRTVAGENCQGFANWSIEWDTTDNGGIPVPQGTYTWRLQMKNCQHGWGAPAIRRFKKRTCIRWWFNLFGIKIGCRQHDVPDGTTEDVPGGVDSVTVVR